MVEAAAARHRRLKCRVSKILLRLSLPGMLLLLLLLFLPGDAELSAHSCMLGHTRGGKCELSMSSQRPRKHGCARAAPASHVHAGIIRGNLNDPCRYLFYFLI